MKPNKDMFKNMTLEATIKSFDDTVVSKSTTEISIPNTPYSFNLNPTTDLNNLTTHRTNMKDFILNQRG